MSCEIGRVRKTAGEKERQAKNKKEKIGEMRENGKQNGIAEVETLPQV